MSLVPMDERQLKDEDIKAYGEIRSEKTAPPVESYNPLSSLGLSTPVGGSNGGGRSSKQLADLRK